MRAKSVYESLSFERGREPKRALRVGIESFYDDIKDNLVKMNNPRKIYKPIEEYIYNGIPIVVFVETFNSGALVGPDPYIAVARWDTDHFISSPWSMSRDDAMANIERLINNSTIE
jgi:hypothetical protein